MTSSDKRGKKPVRFTGAWPSGRRPGAQLRCVWFCVSRYYHYLSTVQINASRPSPSHSATANHSFGFSVTVFSRSALPKTCLEVLTVQTILSSILVYALYLKLGTDRLTYWKLVLLCVHGSSVASHKHRISKGFRSCTVTSFMTNQLSQSFHSIHSITCSRILSNQRSVQLAVYIFFLESPVKFPHLTSFSFSLLCLMLSMIAEKFHFGKIRNRLQ